MAFTKLSASLIAPNKAPPTIRLVTPATPSAGAPLAAASSAEEEALATRLRALRLPIFLSEYDKLARQCEVEGIGHSRYLLQLAELELRYRQRQTAERLIKRARFPALKSLDSFDFAEIPSLNRNLMLSLVGGGYIKRQENVLFVGGSGTGKTHLAIVLGLAACRRGLAVGFFTAASLARQLTEAHSGCSLSRLLSQLAAYKLLIVDELGHVPLSTQSAELLFEALSQRYERGSTIITSNIAVAQWTTIFGTERLTSALLDRLTHRVRIVEMYGESYRVKQRGTQAASSVL